MNIVFLGPPGAGKGTQAARLCAAQGMPHISTGAMLRAAKAAGTELGRTAQEYADRGELVPDNVVTGIVAERLEAADCTEGFLLDGFPRTLRQGELLDETLRQMGRAIDVALLIEAPEEELFRRLTSRGQGRADDDPDVIRNRLAVYAVQTAPLRVFYEKRGQLRVVDGVGTMDEVFERVTAAVGATS